MSDIWKALPHYLENNVNLSALVSDRIYPMRLPQEVDLPAITFQQISQVGTQAFNEPSTLPRNRVQFTIHGGSFASVNPIADALQSALDGYTGMMGASDYLTEVEASILKNEIVQDDPDLGVIQIIQDYIIQIKE